MATEDQITNNMLLGLNDVAEANVKSWQEGQHKVEHHSLKDVKEFIEFMDRRKIANDPNRKIIVNIC